MILYQLNDVMQSSLRAPVDGNVENQQRQEKAERTG